MKDFYRLKYLHYWLIVLLMWCLSQLPYRALLFLGRAVGRLGYYLARKRRRVTEVNISLCFPRLSLVEQKKLAVGSFESMGQYLAECMIAWFFSKRRFSKIPIELKGESAYIEAAQQPKGCLLLMSHMTCMELILRGFHERLQQVPNHVTYASHKNPFIEQFIRSKRLSFASGIWSKQQYRQFVKSVRKGDTVTLFLDQDFGLGNSIFVPFMGIETATLGNIAETVRLCRANVLGVSFGRMSGGRYGIEIIKPNEPQVFNDNPSAALQYNLWVESWVLQRPEQYLWSHRRFKTRPPGQNSFY